jgi:Na+-translocating ferredoxin:NAD+ oxidoreductase RnfD subunit
VASRSPYYPPEKPISQLFAELKDEIKEFVATRIAIFRQEMNEKLKLASAALPALVIALVLAPVAVIFLSVALVAVIAMALGGGAGAWAAGFAIVAALFLLIAGMAAIFAVNRLRVRSLKPERTLRVLHQDQIWLRNQAQSAQSRSKQ